MKTKYLEGVKEPHKVKIYKTFSSEVKVADDIKRILVVTISTPNADRSKDTVQPKGMQYANFLNNPVVLFAHKYDTKPIAKCTGLKISDAGVMATVEFLPEGVYQEADIIYTMYKEGFLNAWSIGFMPLEYEDNTEGGYEFKSWELFEFSSVPVPDNPEALTIMRSKGISEEEAKTIIAKSVEKIDEKPTDEKPAEEKAAIQEDKTPKEVVSEVKAEEKPKEEKPAEVKADEADDDDPSDDTPITELNVGQLKDLLEDAINGEDDDMDQTKDDGKAAKDTVVKDVNEVLALSYVLDCLNFFIGYFTESGVSQDSIDKLTQALALVLEVTKDQAEIGKKTIRLKEGRTISAANEEKLKASYDHMEKAMGHVNDVLSSVNEQNANDNKDDDKQDNDGSSNGDDGKSIEKDDFLLKIANSLKTNNQQTASIAKTQKKTLDILQEIVSEIGGDK